MSEQTWSRPTMAERRAVGLESSWPYMPREVRAQRELVDWARTRRLRYSDRGGCLHWLTTGRCTRGVRTPDCYAVRGWRDHVSGWIQNSRPAVLVAQPYSLDAADRAELAEIARTGLTVEIDPAGGWYGNETVFIGIWRHAPGIQR